MTKPRPGTGIARPPGTRHGQDKVKETGPPGPSGSLPGAVNTLYCLAAGAVLTLVSPDAVAAGVPVSMWLGIIGAREAYQTRQAYRRAQAKVAGTRYAGSAWYYAPCQQPHCRKERAPIPTPLGRLAYLVFGVQASWWCQHRTYVGWVPAAAGGGADGAGVLEVSHELVLPTHRPATAAERSRRGRRDLRIRPVPAGPNAVAIVRARLDGTATLPSSTGRFLQAEMWLTARRRPGGRRKNTGDPSRNEPGL